MASDNGSPSSKTNLAESLVSRFDKLLALIENQNQLMEKQGHTLEKQRNELEEQHKTIKRHTGMLETLEKDATKDDRPHEPRTMEDEQTWGALDKEALAKIKVTVDGWRDLMQISLVFIALFLTVVTAFISPIIQTFTSPPSDDTFSSTGSGKPPLPTVPTQLVALFYYLALIVSIFNSMLCVLGMQWASRLIAVPLGKTNLERTLARERRKAIAERYMLPLMAVLFWTLLLAIGLFVVGFLIQLWELSLSFNGRAPILVLGGALATALSLVILGIIVVTTFHAALHDNSPFESPLSNALRPVLSLIRQRLERKEIKAVNENSWRIVEERAAKDTDDVEALIRWQESDNKDERELKTYARLVIHTNDTELLERASPSFELGKWYTVGDTLFPVFQATRERFTATDTSFRVKDTIDRQLVNFKTWHGWTTLEPEGYVWRIDLQANRLTRWCKDQCASLIESSRENRRALFPLYTFFTSLEAGNHDLRGYRFETYDSCVARVLCSYNQRGYLGDRTLIFMSALRGCQSIIRDDETTLIRDNRPDELSAILAQANLSSLLQSLLRDPNVQWLSVNNLITLITKGREVVILEEMSDFFSSFPEKDIGGPENIIGFVNQLMSWVPPDSPVLPFLDLSPLLALAERKFGRDHFNAWRFGDVMNYYLPYLGCGGLETLSGVHLSREFWETYLRVTLIPVGDDPTQRQAFHGRRYNPRLVPLPSMTRDEHDDLIVTLTDAFKDVDQTQALSSLKGPLWEFLDLDETERNRIATLVLEQVPLSTFVMLLLRSFRWDWNRIKDLIARVVHGRELELLAGLAGFIDDSSVIRDHATCLIVLDLLHQLMQDLPPSFVVPREFDLSTFLYEFSEYEPHGTHWRRDSDVIIFYLDHGAFDALTRPNEIRSFLEYCTQGYWRMEYWEYDLRTSQSTRQRAESYLERLSARRLDLAPEIGIGWFDAQLSPPPERRPHDQPLSIIERVTRALPVRLRNALVRVSGDEVTLHHDLEMAPRSGAHFTAN
ncbi:hypothetical protein SISNIDRAFT_456580 [Sistotremastrum niveocremeum HHB9708]|uniref:DUF6535 domain-containing protein n=1 Tax=Sistotremastrum niveocremeum HHB9708 TaxID=1314777 RepID=A0A164SNG7_9AGAM|nr:hypothetical protein SISNIDRAFT_456580 [Sistotremastrum niveocremeum HHB9708]